MKFQREIVTVAEGCRRVMEVAGLGDVEDIRLEVSLGRRLAEQVYASHHVPHFRRSGYDGFAIRAEETKGAIPERPLLFAVSETIPCGSVARKPLLPGQAVRIMTGAAVPDEADAVVMFEQTDSLEKDGCPYVAVKQEMAAGANISPVGMEIKQGELLLETGRRIGPGEMALLAMFGHPSVSVYKRPRVAIFATGTELLRVEEPLEPGRIRNSNGYMLAAQIREAGGVPCLMETIPDHLEQAKASILAALDEFDAVITTGGVSVGDYDIMYDLTRDWDGRLLFNKVAMRPGSPTTVGVQKGKFLFTLSGNPGACFVGFELFARPVLLNLQGVNDPFQKEFTARLAVDYPIEDKFERYVRGVWYIEEGIVYAKPAGIDASSSTLSIRDSNCLIVIPAGEGGAACGDLVRVLSLGGL